MNKNFVKELPKASGIYIIKNIKDEKVYVGSAVDLPKRYIAHLHMLENNIHSNIHLQRAVNLHGIDSFIFVVLEIIENEKFLLNREQFYLDSYKTDMKYNICVIAGSSLGLTWKQNPDAIYEKTDEHKKKLSEFFRSKHVNLPQGVTYDITRKKYMSQIVYKGNPIFFGRFDSVEEALTPYSRFKENPEKFLAEKNEYIKKKKLNKSSKYIGVHSRSSGKYMSRVRKTIKGIQITYFQKDFDTEEEAYKARCEFIEEWNKTNDIKLR
jgi:group I intron endonuclease